MSEQQRARHGEFSSPDNHSYCRLFKELGLEMTGYGPSLFGNRLVRTRMPGGVEAGGEKPPAIRLNFGGDMQYTEGDQAKLQKKLKNKTIIAKDINSLNRGWYICGTGDDHIWYLHHDGLVHNGCCEYASSAFWPDEESALAFYRKWRKEI